MRQAGCSRTWEAEALTDGRLSGDERRSFERHAASCSGCQAELAALARLRETMAKLPDPPRSTPFERQTRRTALLRAANDRLVGTSTPPMARRTIVAAAVLIAACLLGLGARTWWRADRALLGGSSSTAIATPSFEVVPIGEASWSNRSADAWGRVVLDQGTLSVHVRHLKPGQHFLLTLPDGELEVHGTRFIVEVASGRTQRVEVTEGLVSLRVRGLDEQRLEVGQRWLTATGSGDATAADDRAGATGSASPTAESTPEAHGAPGDLPGPRPQVAPRHPEASRRHAGGASSGLHATADAPASPSASVEPAASAPTAGASAASAQFQAAVEALQRGAFGHAEALFADFARTFPGDERTEDACFLQAAARAKSGDRAGAAVLARSYLQRFPQGLRRKEAERLALPVGAP